MSDRAVVSAEKVCEACAQPMSTAEHLAGPYCANPECYRRGMVILPPLNLVMRHDHHPEKPPSSPPTDVVEAIEEDK